MQKRNPILGHTQKESTEFGRHVEQRITAENERKKERREERQLPRKLNVVGTSNGA